MISEFCCNENFGFQYKISLVSELPQHLQNYGSAGKSLL